jgi:hypothetical protein
MSCIVLSSSPKEAGLFASQMAAVATAPSDVGFTLTAGSVRSPKRMTVGNSGREIQFLTSGTFSVKVQVKDANVTSWNVSHNTTSLSPETMVQNDVFMTSILVENGDTLTIKNTGTSSVTPLGAAANLFVEIFRTF